MFLRHGLMKSVPPQKSTIIRLLLKKPVQKPVEKTSDATGEISDATGEVSDATESVSGK